MESVAQLHKACRLGDINAINHIAQQDKTLLDKFDSNTGWNPLFRTVMCQNLLATQSLLALGASTDLKNNLGETCLHKAVDSGYYQIALELVEWEADPDVKNDQGNTPLHLAALRGDVNMTRLLLRYGASVNIKNNEYAKTPLHFAVELCHEKIAQMLVNYGANPMEPDIEGKTPLDIAILPEIQKILVDPAQESPQGSTNNTSLCNSPEILLDSYRSRPSILEPDIVVSNPSSELYLWLQTWNLEDCYEALAQAGYDDIWSMVEQMNSSIPITIDMLKQIGIQQPGKRHRILAHLLNEVKGLNVPKLQPIRAREQITRKKRFSCSNDQDWVIAPKYMAPDLKDWLNNLRLGALYKAFCRTGYELLSELTCLMGSDIPITDTILANDIGISKQGHRQRILFRLQQEFLMHESSHSLFNKSIIDREEATEACNKCIVM